MANNNQFVVKHGDKRAARTGGKSQPGNVTETQYEAIQIAREPARRYGSELSIQGNDAKFRAKHSCGIDPNPPKG